MAAATEPLFSPGAPDIYSSGKKCPVKVTGSVGIENESSNVAILTLLVAGLLSPEESYLSTIMKLCCLFRGNMTPWPGS